MFELIGSILCSSVLFFIFRLFPKFKVDTAQAIVFNYFTAFVCGSLVSGSLPSLADLAQADCRWWVIVCGFLFISIFIAMGYSSVKNGMGTTSVAVKMSLAISAMFLLFLYRESVSAFKIIGLVLAIAGILLITLEKDNGTGNKPNIPLLLFIFIGSAGLDVVLNVVKKYYLNDYSPALFTAFGFLSAGTIGMIWLIVSFLQKKRTFHLRNIVGGIVLGIPNYFSIYFLVQAYGSMNKSFGLQDSTTLAIMNISIVSLAAIFGMIVFKESARAQKLIGLLFALGAIISLIF